MQSRLPSIVLLCRIRMGLKNVKTLYEPERFVYISAINRTGSKPKDHRSDTVGPSCILAYGCVDVEFLHNAVIRVIIDCVVSFVEDKETNVPS